MAKDQACGATLTNLMTTLIKGDVKDKTTGIMSLATLIVLLKKDAAAMSAL